MNVLQWFDTDCMQIWLKFMVFSLLDLCSSPGKRISRCHDNLIFLSALDMTLKIFAETFNRQF